MFKMSELYDKDFEEIGREHFQNLSDDEKYEFYKMFGIDKINAILDEPMIETEKLIVELFTKICRKKDICIYKELLDKGIDMKVFPGLTRNRVLKDIIIDVLNNGLSDLEKELYSGKLIICSANASKNRWNFCISEKNLGATYVICILLARGKIEYIYLFPIKLIENIISNNRFSIGEYDRKTLLGKYEVSEKIFNQIKDKFDTLQ